MSILFAKIDNAPAVHSNQFVDIPKLTFELPKASATQRHALIILNVPMPYAEGAEVPGLNFGIEVGETVVAEGGFTYSTTKPEAFGRMPFTLVVRVELDANHTQEVTAQWKSVRESTGHIDSFASLSAVLG